MAAQDSKQTSYARTTQVLAKIHEVAVGEDAADTSAEGPKSNEDVETMFPYHWFVESRLENSKSTRAETAPEAEDQDAATIPEMLQLYHEFGRVSRMVGGVAQDGALLKLDAEVMDEYQEICAKYKSISEQLFNNLQAEKRARLDAEAKAAEYEHRLKLSLEQGGISKLPKPQSD